MRKFFFSRSKLPEIIREDVRHKEYDTKQKSKIQKEIKNKRWNNYFQLLSSFFLYLTSLKDKKIYIK